MSGYSAYLITSPSDFTLTDDYRTFCESLLKYFRESSGTTSLLITPEIGRLYRFDFTQFLLAQNVPAEDHYLVMRINGYSSIHQIDESINQILSPNMAMVARFKQIYRTSLTST
jgi:hypothetical protein